jgi:CRISPR system Cascade subunit CasA
MEYGTMMAVVTELITDRITFNAGLLTSLGQEWIPRIISVVALTEKCVNVLAMLARDLVKSAGSDAKDSKLLDKAARNAREMAYAELDGSFRTWLASIDPSATDQMDEVCDRWNEFVRGLILQIGSSLIDKIEPGVMSGRDVNVFTANLKFKGSIFKNIPIKKKGGENGR